MLQLNSFCIINFLFTTMGCINFYIPLNFKINQFIYSSLILYELVFIHICWVSWAKRNYEISYLLLSLFSTWKAVLKVNRFATMGQSSHLQYFILTFTSPTTPSEHVYKVRPKYNEKFWRSTILKKERQNCLTFFKMLSSCLPTLVHAVFHWQ